MERKKKIIIVDDFSGVRSIVKESLNRRGYEVLEANNAEDALKFFNGTQIDLLITDFDMPDMNGAEMVTRIRSMSRYIYTPVIILSGVRKERIEDELTDLNIAAYIQKPFDVRQFYSVVERLAGKTNLI
jgi:two-component system, chemotaxis family, chemotaxis protein CheY